MAGRIKVNLRLAIEVDAEAWDAAYGTGTDRARVAADVAAYVLHQVQESNAMVEAGAEVTLR